MSTSSENPIAAKTKGAKSGPVSKESELVEEIGSICAVCSKPTAHKCQRCLRIFYCSRECQRYDWKSRHKHICPIDRSDNGDFVAIAGQHGNQSGNYLSESASSPNNHSRSDIARWFHQYKSWVQQLRGWVYIEDLLQELNQLLKTLTLIPRGVIGKLDAVIWDQEQLQTTPFFPFLKLYTSESGNRTFCPKIFASEENRARFFPLIASLFNILSIELLNRPSRSKKLLPQVLLRGTVVADWQINSLQDNINENVLLNLQNVASTALVSALSGGKGADNERLFDNWFTDRRRIAEANESHVLWRFTVIQLEDSLLRQFQNSCPNASVVSSIYDLSEFADHDTFNCRSQEWLVRVFPNRIKSINYNTEARIHSVELLLLDHCLYTNSEIVDQFIFWILENYSLNQHLAIVVHDQENNELSTLHDDIVCLLNSLPANEEAKDQLEVNNDDVLELLVSKVDNEARSRRLWKLLCTYTLSLARFSLFGDVLISPKEMVVVFAFQFSLRIYDIALESLNQNVSAEKCFDTFNQRLDIDYVTYRLRFDGATRKVSPPLENNFASFLANLDWKHNLEMARVQMNYYSSLCVLQKYWKLPTEQSEAAIEELISASAQIGKAGDT